MLRKIGACVDKDLFKCWGTFKIYVIEKLWGFFFWDRGLDFGLVGWEAEEWSGGESF